jgi:hypothetical protein
LDVAITELERKVCNINSLIENVTDVIAEIKEMIFIDPSAICQKVWSLDDFLTTLRSSIRESREELSKLISKFDLHLKVKVH